MGMLEALKKLFNSSEELDNIEEKAIETEETYKIDEEDKVLVALAASAMAGKEKQNSRFHISKITRINMEGCLMNMKKYVIKLNDKVYEVEIEEVIGDETATTSVSSKPAQPDNAVSAPVLNSAGEKIEAPMPGNILDVPVKVGDVVKKGQVLLILEAMKMENEIVSPVDGKVVSVNVSKGQTVNAGDALIQIG